MKEFNEEYLDNIRKIIAEHDDAKARELLDELHPADIAELYNDLDLDQAEYLYKLLGATRPPTCSWSSTKTTATSSSPTWSPRTSPVNSWATSTPTRP